MLTSIPKPKGINTLSNREILMGNTIAPIDRLKIIDEDTYEDMVLEWLTSFVGKYERTLRFGGSGDNGIDVIAYLDYNKKESHYFQCKHYNHALIPSEIYLELGKLCYYTFVNEIDIPKKYFFLAPQGIGAKLHKLINKPKSINSELLNEWGKKCKNKITSKKSIELTQDLSDYIKAFDFSILDSIEPLNFIEEYKNTNYYSYRFGGGLLVKRDSSKIKKPSSKIEKREINYVTNLYDAYSDYLKQKVNSDKDFESDKNIKNHFLRQRSNFYHAEALEQFSRDALPFGNTSFNDLKDEIFEHIIEVCESQEHDNGLIRLNETIKMAKTSSYLSNPLTSELKAQDKSGICHHLSNENKLKWT